MTTIAILDKIFFKEVVVYNSDLKIVSEEEQEKELF